MTLNKQSSDYVFVGVQLLLFLLYIFEWLPRFSTPAPVFYASAVLSVLGITIVVSALLKLDKNLTAFPTPKAGSQLVQTGLYKWVRHPIYTGIIIFVFAFAAALGSPHKFLVSGALLILFYLKTHYEEHRLGQKYSDYAKYRRKTGRFFPKL